MHEQMSLDAERVLSRNSGGIHHSVWKAHGKPFQPASGANESMCNLTHNMTGHQG